MPLADKLRNIWAQPADADLCAYLGVPAGDVAVGPDGVRAGDESVPLEEALRLVAQPPVPVTPQPRRTIAVGDLYLSTDNPECGS